MERFIYTSASSGLDCCSHASFKLSEADYNFSKNATAKLLTNKPTHGSLYSSIDWLPIKFIHSNCLGQLTVINSLSKVVLSFIFLISVKADVCEVLNNPGNPWKCSIEINIYLLSTLKGNATHLCKIMCSVR